jgi:hypothetical protein
VCEEEEQRFHGESSVSPLMAEQAAAIAEPGRCAVAGQSPRRQPRRLPRSGCRCRRRAPACVRRSRAANRVSCCRSKPKYGRYRDRAWPDRRKRLCASGRNRNVEDGDSGGRRWTAGSRTVQSRGFLKIFGRESFKLFLVEEPSRSSGSPLRRAHGPSSYGGAAVAVPALREPGALSRSARRLAGPAAFASAL